MSFKEKGYRHMDAQQAKTDHNSSQGSGALTKMANQNRLKRKVTILSKFETSDREINILH